MKKIEALEPSKHIQGRFLIRFEGERELLKVTENEVASFSLYSGRELEEDELAALQKAGSLSSAKARGARMLGERPLSRKELVRRLTEKGETPENAEAAADWLADIGALDEAGYARSVVRHYSSWESGEPWNRSAPLSVTGWRSWATLTMLPMPAWLPATFRPKATGSASCGMSFIAGAFPGNSGRMPWKSGAIRRSGSPHS